MADKKSFVLYLDNEKQVNMLTDEQAGKLFKALFRFAKTGKETDFDDLGMQMIFSFMADSIKRDSEKYEEICEKRRIAGKKGGAPKRNGNASKQAKGCFDKQKQAKQPDNDNENVNDNDNENVNDNVTDNVTDSERETLPPENKQPFGDLKNVFLKDEEYKNLEERFGNEFLNQEISSLSTYMASHEKNYPNHYATLLNWCLKDFEKFKDKNKYSEFTGKRLYEFDIAALKDFDETYNCFVNNYSVSEPTEEKSEEEPEEEPETKPDYILSPEEMDAICKKYGFGKYNALLQEENQEQKIETESFQENNYSPEDEELLRNFKRKIS